MFYYTFFSIILSRTCNKKNNLFYLIIFLLLKILEGSREHFLLNPNEVFILVINRTDFDKQILKSEKLLITATLNGMPDLPGNIFFKQRDLLSNAFLYGFPSNDEDIEIELIAKILSTYETIKDLITLRFTAKNTTPKNEIELKIKNYNIEDMIEKKNDIIEIFKNYLWKDSKNLFMNFLASPIDVGGRFPLNPNDNEGVVFRVSSTSNFSQDLLILDREVKPIKKRIPCPSQYKSTSVEYIFKKNKIKIDWCSFKLFPKTNYLF